MKQHELLKLLKKAGCKYLRDGGNHDIWYSPLNSHQFSVPRHKGELDTGTAKGILKEAGIKK